MVLAIVLLLDFCEVEDIVKNNNNSLNDSQNCTKEAQVTMIPLLKERKPIITTNNVVVQEGNTTRRQHG
jgi:hypothetical protein